ncbi:MAG: DUF1553 domain-containing protein [Acidobacteria bacterium]|nr:DUF1553 domain-containing protein [Acidobacteriota bacterium]
MRLLLALFAAATWASEAEVQAILRSRCASCHASTNHFALDDPDPAKILAAVSGPKPRMPKAGPPLTNGEWAVIEAWARDARPKWWSFQPLRTSAGHGIDEFVRGTLQAKGIAPSKEADRRTLVRRLTFDLHGLPPTPAQIRAFLDDPAPGAYERLVDRLLAAPQYGERWARHWLDVIHYGESHGYDKDKPRLNAWPYRDYVIQSLNHDKPYALFVKEQIAGDVLYPESAEAKIATGFLAAGPWDFVGHQELKEGTFDKDNTRTLDRDDVVAQVMSTFTSVTAHCARCHDHKFDPIPQKDYYNLQAVFAGIDRADQPFDDDPAVYSRRRALLARKREVQRRLQPLLDQVERASNPEIVALDISIQDASLLITHMGTPKTPAEAEEKARLEARRIADRKRREEIVNTLIGAEVFAGTDRIKAEMAPIDAALAALPAPRLVYAGANFFQRAGNFRPPLEPRPVHVLARGNVRAAGEPAQAGALSVLRLPFSASDGASEGARRGSLAEWITHRENVLTWRSVVNRVWQYHFGTGLVESSNDFGRMGAKPSHPELLDWLALWFRDEARGSLKQLHRLIVTSATYRQSSAHREEAAKIDADNKLLWRMNRMRVDAEAVRDAMLLAAGKLDPAMGGPSVRMFLFKDDHSPVYDYAGFAPDSPGAYRRSIYRFIVRSVPDPFMDRLDCPDPSILTPKRSTTITAIQALALWNNAFVLRMAEHFAERVQGAPQPIELAYWHALGRPPSPGEANRHAAYVREHGLANFARVLFNANEFLFVD